MITGSPHKKGTSALLVDEFMRGAIDSRHEVFRFDSAFEDVTPCLGCGRCRETGACVQKDAMEKLYPRLVNADAIIFAMPVYYFGMPAQIKAVVDRFYFPESKMVGSKKTALLATAYSPNREVADPLVEQYRKIANYMNWDDAGVILVTGCGVREDIEHSEFPEQAFKMGKEI